MPIAYRTIPGLGLTVSVWDGIITAQDSLDYVLRVAADHDWPPGPLGLVDMRTLLEFAPPDPHVAAELLDASDKADTVRRIAVLALLVGDQPRTGLGDELGLHAERFGDLGAACSFLGVPPHHVEPILAEVRADLASGPPL